jgi:hypothetical protein
MAYGKKLLACIFTLSPTNNILLWPVLEKMEKNRLFAPVTLYVINHFSDKTVVIKVIMMTIIC